MDISLEYIKMCERAEEIQNAWQPSHGDYYWGRDSISELSDRLYDRNFYEVHLLADFDSEGGWFHLEPEHIDKRRHTWLPRQDQLQGMLYGKDYSTKVGNIQIPEKTDMWSILPSFFKWAYNWEFNDNFVTLTKANAFQSMEQLWLAFVMSERYKKVWDGTSEEWVEILEGIRV